MSTVIVIWIIVDEGYDKDWQTKSGTLLQQHILCKWLSSSVISHSGISKY